MSEGNDTSPESNLPETETIDLESSLHPFEKSRLTIALVGGFVILFGVVALVIAQGPVRLLTLALVLTVILGSFWVSLQILRARLLANAIIVEPEALPDIYAALVTVRKQLAYYRRVDVYVTAEVTGKAVWMNFLGHRVILLEGDFVSGIVSAYGQAGLRFIIGSFLGALKARHSRLQPLVLLLQLSNAVRIVTPFILPYHRATRYSGDQLGYRCSGDLRAAAGTVGCLIVGTLVAPDLRVHGVVNQIELVQQRSLPRLAQLFSAEPHLVNRYLNVLAFSAQVAPQELRALTEDLDNNTRQRLELLLASTPHARKQPERWLQKKSLRPVYFYLIIGLAAFVVVFLGLVFDRNRDGQTVLNGLPSSEPSGTSASTAAVPTNSYTAWELFGAATQNGSCETTSLENTNHWLRD